ncbi:MAG: class I SAM-dependent methyltransferase [Jiangellaceae bacterium]
MRAQIGAAYSASARAWATGPIRIYGRMAGALADHCPVPLTGRLALDVGSGTGAATLALQERGAQVVALDAAAGMIASGPAPGVVGDARLLPFRDQAFAAVAAAFCLNHIDPPSDGMREMRRVTESGGAVLVSSYGTDPDHPVKPAVQASLAAAGHVVPDWYDLIQAGPAADLATPEGMARAALDADLDAEVTEIDIAFPELGAADLVAWRMGMAHNAPFVASLASADRDAVVARALEALGDPPMLVRRIVVLTAVV